MIRGTRIPVRVILELLAAGETVEDLLADNDELRRDDILAALEYGALTAGGQLVTVPAT